MLQFTDAILIGNPTIDAEHKALFQILNDAQNEIAGGFCPKESLIRIEESLVAYANTHLKHEEDYMREINDPEYAIQIIEHKNFRARVSGIEKDIVESDEAKKQVLDLIEYVAKWIYQHIIYSDSLIGKIPRVDDNNEEEAFAFTAKYFTGIEKIDNQHRQLFALIRRAYDTLHHSDNLSDVEVSDAVLGIVDELLDYTNTHFCEEEEYMSSINYSGLEKQQKAHTAFIDKLKDIDVENSGMSPREYLDDLIDYLTFWLSNHILLMDTQIPMK